MSGKPSRVRQREIQQIVRGAIKAGATSATVNIGGASVVIAFNSDKQDLADANEWLKDDDSHKA
jgi:hypothetical protein